VRDLDHPVKKSIPEEVQAIFDKRPHTTPADWNRIESWSTLLYRGYGQDRASLRAKLKNANNALTLESKRSGMLRASSFLSSHRSSRAQGEPKETGEDDLTPAILNYLLSLCEVSGVSQDVP